MLARVFEYGPDGLVSLCLWLCVIDSMVRCLSMLMFTWCVLLSLLLLLCPGCRALVCVCIVGCCKMPLCAALCAPMCRYLLPLSWHCVDDCCVSALCGVEGGCECVGVCIVSCVIFVDAVVRWLLAAATAGCLSCCACVL